MVLMFSLDKYHVIMSVQVRERGGVFANKGGAGRGGEWKGRIVSNLPVYCRDGCPELVFDLLGLHELGVCINAASLLEGRDSPTHPRRAAVEFVI